MTGVVEVLLRVRGSAVIARSAANEAIQSLFVALDCFASLAMTRRYPLNVPLRSLNRSSGCGARTLGVCGESDAFAVATEVSDEPLPHNSCTAADTGCA